MRNRITKKYLKIFNKAALRESVKEGKFLEFIHQCLALIRDYELALVGRKQEDYIDNFYTIEIFLKEYEDDYIISRSYLDYLSNIKEKELNKLYDKSNKNLIKKLGSR